MAVIDVDDTQAQPFIQNHARADVAAHATHQGLEGQLCPLACEARQGLHAALTDTSATKDQFTAIRAAPAFSLTPTAGELN